MLPRVLLAFAALLAVPLVYTAVAKSANVWREDTAWHDDAGWGSVAVPADRKHITVRR